MKRILLYIVFLFVFFFVGCVPEGVKESIEKQNKEISSPAFQEYLRDRVKFKSGRLAEYKGYLQHQDNLKSWYK